MKIKDWKTHLKALGNVDKKLIAIVRTHTALYDGNDPHYKDSQFIGKEWEHIAKQLNFKSGSDVKKHWLKLRDRHRQALRRQTQNRVNGVLEENIKPWKHEKQMQFLLMHMGHRIRGPNKPKVHSSTVEEDDKMTKDDEIKSQVIVIDSDDAEDLFPTELKPEEPDPKANGRAEVQENCEKKHDLYYFFMSMYEQTMKMPATSQHIVRRNVFLTVAEEEARLLNIVDYQPASNMY